MLARREMSCIQTQKKKEKAELPHFAILKEYYLFATD